MNRIYYRIQSAVSGYPSVKEKNSARGLLKKSQEAVLYSA